MGESLQCGLHRKWDSISYQCAAMLQLTLFLAKSGDKLFLEERTQPKAWKFMLVYASSKDKP